MNGKLVKKNPYNRKKRSNNFQAQKKERNRERGRANKRVRDKKGGINNNQKGESSDTKRELTISM